MGTFITGNAALFADRTAGPRATTGASYEVTHDHINSLKAALQDLRAQIYSMPLENYLPNTQWCIATAIGSNAKMGSSGLGTLAPVTVSSYTTGSNTVTALCADTGELKVNDLVFFNSPADAALRVCCSRIDAITPNVSFTFSLPRGVTASSSTSCTASPSMVGGLSSIGTGDALDGWSKTTTAQVWREDNAVNAKAGSKYSCGFKKGASGTESMWCAFTKKNIGPFLGRTIVFGAWVYHKVKGGSGTWNLRLSSDGTGALGVTGTSATTTAYEWKELSATIPADATTFNCVIEFKGNTNDVYYVSQPMMTFGNSLGVGNYRHPKTEIIQPKVKISPHINVSLTFGQAPSAASDNTAAHGGGVGNDFVIAVRTYPETNGAIAVECKKLLMQLEARNASTTMTRFNSLKALKVKCSTGGTRGTAQFQVSSDGGSSYGTAITPGSGATTFQVVATGDANYADVRYQVFNVGNGGTYGLNDTWTFALPNGAKTFSGSGYDGIGITTLTQTVALGARDVVSAPIKYGLLMENKVGTALETQNGWVTLDSNGDFQLYTGTMSAAWYNESIDINGMEL